MILMVNNLNIYFRLKLYMGLYPGEKALSAEERPIELVDRGTRTIGAARVLHDEDNRILICFRLVVYMLPLYIGQWLFWGGLATLAGDLYCPTNVWGLAVIWLVFSTTGMLLSPAF